MKKINADTSRRGRLIISESEALRLSVPDHLPKHPPSPFCKACRDTGFECVDKHHNRAVRPPLRDVEAYRKWIEEVKPAYIHCRSCRRGRRMALEAARRGQVEGGGDERFDV